MIAGGVALLAIIVGIVYLNRPAPPQPGNEQASPEAKAYVDNLQLSNVQMKATENFMKQEVVEVEGNITNRGSRSLQSVDVFCLFYGIDGREIHRERVPILKLKNGSLKPGETRPFRLPFDSLPDGWNQAMPRLVIAQITFAQ